jgi:hypothetical protein
VAYFNLLSLNSPGKTEDKHETTQSGQPKPRPGFQPGISRTEVQSLSSYSFYTTTPPEAQVIFHTHPVSPTCVKLKILFNLFVAYLTTLSITQNIKLQMIRRFMNNEFEKICKGAVIA